ncbi:type 3 dihydrofolate reductase [Methylonatrum kenyense]|uniref:type 3 dihydrofolate reductase n=1 Tax=Methylonatrum kenyense TaxID=455253 RepID=UPI0020C14FAB|nr:type 3 dihydrofolate reductase [Methylonatrum kenyense]MCK8517042.1 type 3 dihydrofolate reductase [Methylonatrum kenyense]
MLISLIAALTPDHVIGRDNDLPWRIPSELKHFRAVTMGKPIVMGRRNHESIGRPLPGRRNIVLTRNSGFRAEGCTVVHDMQAALDACGDAPEVMVIGGADLYRSFLPLAGRLYLTWVEAEIPGDTYFPALDAADWQLRNERRVPAGEESPYPLCYQVLERRTGNAQ